MCYPGEFDVALANAAVALPSWRKPAISSQSPGDDLKTVVVEPAATLLVSTHNIKLIIVLFFFLYFYFYFYVFSNELTVKNFANFYLIFFVRLLSYFVVACTSGPDGLGIHCAENRDLVSFFTLMVGN